MSGRVRGLVAVVVAVAAACGIPPLRSDTGFRGTWRRSNDRNSSIVSIVASDGAYRFRWTKRSFDGKLTVLCDWDGRCEERLNGALMATYRIRTWLENGKLYTETVENRQVPEARTFRYTDEMEVADGGMTLWNYTVERDGQRLQGNERPRRSFHKVADGVAEPPP